jgi:hypothetical protein
MRLVISQRLSLDYHFAPRGFAWLRLRFTLTGKSDLPGAVLKHLRWLFMVLIQRDTLLGVGSRQSSPNTSTNPTD